jgi:hypothetical protein
MISRIFEMSKGNNHLKIRNMKKYYVNGQEITEQEAKAIEARNAEYMSSTDFSLWAKCEFITVVTK